MPRGGKRKGAGRPRYAKEDRTIDVWLRLRAATAKRLNAAFPAHTGQRSEFVSDLIDANL